MRFAYSRTQTDVVVPIGLSILGKRRQDEWGRQGRQESQHKREKDIASLEATCTEVSQPDSTITGVLPTIAARPSIPRHGCP